MSNGTSTSYTWSDYSKGDHKFEVRAQDNKGEYSNIIVWEFTYQKENEPPTVTKVSGPSEVVSESSSTFTWTGSDSDGTITKYEYRKDGGNWVSNGTSTSYTWSDYSKGDHKFEVRAQDNDGEYSNVVKWEFEYSFHEEAPTITWQKFFGGSGSEGAYSVQQTNDGGYVVFGDTRSDDGDVTGNNGGQDFWVVKVNSSGSIKWQKCLGGSDNEDSSSSCVDADGEASIQQTSDGGYVVVGSTDSNDGDVSGNHGKTDFWVVKLNSTGEILWQKCLGGSSFDFGHSIQQTSDGGYVVVGLTDSNDGDVSGNHGSSDAWIVKLNSIGSIEWQKCLGGSGYEQATSIEQTSEGGYIVVGLTTSNDGDVSGNHEDAWVVKLNSTGSILWQKCLGEYDCAYLAFSIEQTSDNGYVVAGFRASNEAEEVSGILIKLDNSGSINWQMCFDKSGYDNILYSVKQTSDNGYIVAGASLNHEENFDFWLLKLD